MRLPTALLAAAAFLPPTPALSQFSTAGFCSDSGATVHISFRSPIQMERITGAPYSARETDESVRGGPNGAIETSSEQYDSVWRDSTGRTRKETHEEPGTRAPCRSFLYRIEYPVAAYAYLVDPVNKVVHRIALAAWPEPIEPKIRYAEESLGTKTISGLSVVGSKLNRTSPPPRRRPDDPPRNFTVEVWRSPELGLVVYSKTTQQDGSPCGSYAA
jgi:hypothetical protein